MCVRLILCIVILAFLRETEEVTCGRDAKAGEFPFVVRILISEEITAVIDEHRDDLHGEGYPTDKTKTRHIDQHTKNVMQSYGDIHLTGDSNASRIDINSSEHQHSHDHGGTVSAGVLITMSRVLTTCDSVGFFAGEKVNLYNLNKVSVLAGSVNVTGDGGQFRNPSSSNIHPLCYFVTSMMTVLFNYGVYEFAKPFDSLKVKGSDVPLIAPIKNQLTSDAMELTLWTLRNGEEEVECSTAGWGNYKREFEGRGMPDDFQRFAPILQTTKMKIVDYPECYESTCENFDDCVSSILETGYVCAKAPKGGPCTEDNGAPLICEGEVLAILIHPKICTNIGYPRLFLRLDLVFDYVFGIKNRSNVNAEANTTILALLILFQFHVHSVHS